MIDTLMYVKKLEASGFPRNQAELQVQIMTDIVDQSYSTKQDLKDLGVDLRQEMKDLGTELRQEMRDLGAELRLEMRDLSVDLRKEMREIGFEMRALENRLTLKLGSMMLVGFAGLAAFIKLV